MNVYEVGSLSQKLSTNAYPGRGIVLGVTADGKKAVAAYFIMGRSVNSRNRVFIEEADGIRTEAHDPALIPSFCGEGFYGLRVHQAALDYGVKVTGATVHFVNEIPDGGEIIAQKAVYIEEGDTPEVLQRRVMEQAEWILLPQAAEKVCASL